MTARFDEYGAIYHATIDGFAAFVVSDPAYAQHVLRANWQNYTKGWAIRRVAFLLGNGLMASEGELWQSQRRMIQPAFHKSAISALFRAIAAANAALLERWKDAARKATRVNVTREVSLLVLEVILAAIFGDDTPSVAPHFAILSAETERDLRFAQEFRALRKIVLRVVAARRNAARDAPDLLGMLMAVRSRADAAMPDPQLVNEVMTLIVAGHETTASVLTWAWYLLAHHPAVEERLSREVARGVSGIDELAEFAYARQVLEEVLRLYPPGWLLTRKALGDDWLGDYFVPAGTEIYISPYLIQRNPDHWLAPDMFDPDRFAPARAESRHPMAMLPFSAGPRNCVGESLARLEMEIHLATIARDIRLRHDETAPPILDAGVNLRAKHDFWMTPEIRAAARP
jgi:cytochrome P450